MRDGFRERIHMFFVNRNLRMAAAMICSLFVVLALNRVIFVSNSPQPNFLTLQTIPGNAQRFIAGILVKKVTPQPSVLPTPTPVNTAIQTVSPTAPHSEIPTNTPVSSPTEEPQVSPTQKQKKTPTPTQKQSVKPTKKPTQIPSTSCQKSSSEQYGSRGLNPPDLGAHSNPDTVMSLRGWTPSNGEPKLVTYGYPQGEPPDPNAPQLGTILGNGPSFSSLYRVLPDQKDNSLAGLTSNVGQTVRAPTNGYNIGGGYQYMVVYASDKEITMNVTGDDQAIDGYAIHMYGFCVDPNLVSLYQELNAGGRRLLPALYGGQKMGTANGTEVKVAIRDSGTFMDPRSRLDWWKGY